MTGADSFGQLSSGIPNSILSGIVYWLIAGTVMAILFVITGWLIIGIGYQVGKIYRKYCWDIISIVVAITSTAVVIYFGEWIKNANPINLIVLLLLSHIIYIGIRCYVKDWMEERGYYYKRAGKFHNLLVLSKGLLIVYIKKKYINKS